MPISANVPGVGIIQVPDDLTLEQQADYLRRAAEAKGVFIPLPKRTWGQAATDVGAALTGGIGSIVALPGQLSGLATGDMDNVLTRAGAELQKFGQESKSARLQQMERERAAKVAAEDSELGKFWTAFKETGANPALFTSFLAEQAPQLLVGGVGAKAAKLAATGAAKVAGRELGEAALEKAATSGAVGAGVTAQGADIANDTYQSVMKDKDLDKTPEYKALIKQGLNPDDARQELAISSARKAALGAGAVSYAASRLPGGRAIEEAVAGKFKPGMIRGIATAAPGEALSEAIEEGGGQAVSNIAMPGERDITSGVGEAAAYGALGGLGMGTGVGALSGMVGGARERQRQAMEAAIEEKRARDAAIPQVKQLEHPQASEVAPEQIRAEADGFVSSLAPGKAFTLDDVVTNTGDAINHGGDATAVVNDLLNRGEVVQTPEGFVRNEGNLAPILPPTNRYVYTVPTTREGAEVNDGFQIEAPALKLSRTVKTQEEADRVKDLITKDAAEKAKPIDEEIKNLNGQIADINKGLEKATVTPRLKQKGLDYLAEGARQDIEKIQTRISELEEQKATLTAEPTVTPINPRKEVENGYQVREYRPDGPAKILKDFATPEEAHKEVIDNSSREQLEAIYQSTEPQFEPVRNELQKRIDAIEKPETVPEDVKPEEGPTEVTPEMEQKLTAVTSRMRGVLDQMGLQNIGLNIQQKLQSAVNGQMKPVDGYYLNRVISASLEGSRDVTATIGHETIHALRELGMFSDKEWDILTKRAKDEWIKKYDTKGRYKALGLSDEKIIEEAVADAFGDWLQGNLKERGVIAGLFNRIKLMLEKMGSVLRGQGFTTSEDVFKRARTGRLQGERVERPAEGQQFALPRTVNVDGVERPTRISEEARANVAVSGSDIMEGMGIPEEEHAQYWGNLSLEEIDALIEKYFRSVSGAGRVIHPTIEGVKNFWRWFGNSKIVNKDGTPKVMYHGTARDISEFRKQQANAIFVTEDPEFARTFADMSLGWMVKNATQVLDDKTLELAIDAGITEAVLEDAVTNKFAKEWLKDHEGFSLKNILRDVLSSPMSDYVSARIQDELPSKDNIIQLYVRAEKTFDYDSQEDRDALMAWAKSLDKNNPARQFIEDKKNEIEFGEWEVIESPAVQDFIKSSGYDSFYMYETGRKNLAVYDPNQLKSAVGNVGAFSRDSGEIQYALPFNELINTASLDESNRIAKSKSWSKGRDLKMELQNRVLDAASKAKIDITKDSEQTREYLREVGLKDALSALRQNPNAIGWYDLKTRQALAVMSLVHPEILTNENNRFAFTWALAVTSNGIKVDKNFELAEQAYVYYKQNGVMPTNIGVGTAKTQINNALSLFNELQKEWGINSFRKFMQTNFTVKEITGISKALKPSGEHADVTVKGAAIIGPKIGNGFFSNLYGDFDSLTMDRWLIRTWGRWTGTLIKSMPEQTQKATDRLSENVSKILNTPEEAQRLGKLIGFEINEKSDLNKLAQAVQKASMVPSIRGELNKTDDGLELRKAGNSLAKYLDGQKEAPENPDERKYIRAIFKDILNKLKERTEYQDLTMADLQAVLWYAEKRLYETARESSEELKSDEDVEGYADEEAPDYANAAAKVARQNGVDELDIIETLKRIEDERPRAAGLTTGKGVGVKQTSGTGQQGTVGGFTGRERKIFIGERAVLRARADRRSDSKQPEAYSREGDKNGGSVRLLKSLGVSYTNVWKINKQTGNIFRANKLATPEFFELSQDLKNAQKFQSAIAQNKAHHPYGAAVTVYPAKEYAKMRLFLSEDGKSGVAIKPDGDVVSVFSTGGAGRAIMELAVAVGGKKLDAFDTMLPELYAAHGFRAVARTKWNNEFAPKGWNKKTFEEYNGGEPDVVFMVYDPEKIDSKYSKQDGLVMTGDNDYDRAVDEQNRVAQSINFEQNDSALFAVPFNTYDKASYALDSIVKNVPTVTRSVADRINLTGTTTSKAIWKCLTLGQLAEVAKGWFPYIGKFKTITDEMFGYRDHLVYGAARIAEEWQTLTVKNKGAANAMANVMHDATVNGFDPDRERRKDFKTKQLIEPKNDIERDIQRRYDNLPEEYKALYKKVRNYYSWRMSEYMNLLEKRIQDAVEDKNKAREMVQRLKDRYETGRVPGPYFPLSRFGDFWVSFKLNGEPEYHMFENEKERDRFYAEMAGKGATELNKGYKLSDIYGNNKNTFGFVKDIIENIEGGKSVSELKDDVWQMYLRHLPEVSMRKHFIHRKNVAGYNTDALRAFQTNTFHGAYYMGRLKYSGEIANAITEAAKIASREVDNETRTKAQALVEELGQREAAMMNPADSTWYTQLAGSFGFMYYLATPAAALVNLSQNFIVAFPVMGGRFGYTRAGKELSRAMKQFTGSAQFKQQETVYNTLTSAFDVRRTLEQLQKEATSPSEKKRYEYELKAIEDLYLNGSISRSQAMDMAGASDSVTGGVLQTTNKFLGMAFHGAEVFNRTTTALAAYRMAMEDNANMPFEQRHQKAVAVASEVVEKAHFNYSAANEAPVFKSLGSLGKVVLMFKKYSQAMTYLLVNETKLYGQYLRNKFKGTEMEDEAIARAKEARNTMLGVLGMTGIFAGTLGLPYPLVALTMAMFNMTFGGDDDEEYFDAEAKFKNWLAETFGSDAAIAIANGPVSYLTGADLANRVGLNGIWFRDTGDAKDETDAVQKWLTGIMGPAAGTAMNIGLGMQRINEGQLSRGVETMLPSFLKAPWKAFRFFKEGALSMNGDPIVDEISNYETFLTAIGFTPSRLAAQYKENAEVKGAEMRINTERKRILGRFALALNNDDYDAMDEIQQDIEEFNEKNPEVEITYETLQRSLRSRQEAEAETEHGIRIGKKLKSRLSDYRYLEED